MTSYEFDHQTGRFRVRACGDGGWAIIDTRDGGEVEIGTDVCEPEDALLVRDLAWVRDALNTVDDAAQKRIAELTRENEELRARDIEANDACVRMEKRIAELSAKCDAAMGALDEMCDALGIPTDGRADGPSATAALAQARKEGFREAADAMAETVGRLREAAE